MGVKVGVGCTRDGIHAARERNLFRDILRPHSHKHTVTGRRHCRPRVFPGRPRTIADDLQFIGRAVTRRLGSTCAVESIRLTTKGFLREKNRSALWVVMFEDHGRLEIGTFDR